LIGFELIAFGDRDGDRLHLFSWGWFTGFIIGYSPLGSTLLVNQIAYRCTELLNECFLDIFYELLRRGAAVWLGDRR